MYLIFIDEYEREAYPRGQRLGILFTIVRGWKGLPLI